LEEEHAKKRSPSARAAGRVSEARSLLRTAAIIAWLCSFAFLLFAFFAPSSLAAPRPPSARGVCPHVKPARPSVHLVGGVDGLPVVCLGGPNLFGLQEPRRTSLGPKSVRRQTRTSPAAWPALCCARPSGPRRRAMGRRARTTLVGLALPETRAAAARRAQCTEHRARACSASNGPQCRPQQRPPIGRLGPASARRPPTDLVSLAREFVWPASHTNWLAARQRHLATRRSMHNGPAGPQTQLDWRQR